ncbi:hypothetical protein HDU77_002716 [Chytriomyces hyalinus]|nr:hypothetical protein HDU77_002716 [Chytriomyces hyalinus]
MERSRHPDRERMEHRHRPYERDGRTRNDDRDDRNGRGRDSRHSGTGANQQPLGESGGERGGEGGFDRRNGGGNERRSAGMNGSEPETGTSKNPEADKKPKEAPNFGVSGALTAEANTFKGVVLKYAEPPEARKPSVKYRLYAFKGRDQIDMVPVSRQSAYLFGRERLVADIPVDHPSASKQHAVLQFRSVTDKESGRRIVKPYLIDLDSANGTSLNGEKMAPSRYYELTTTDVIKFGFSSRDYVLMDEGQADDDD